MVQLKMRKVLYLFCNIAFLATGRDILPNGTGSKDSIILDDSWHLWLDERAEWKNDTLYLPDEVELAKLPVNPPTGGWDILNKLTGIPVTLPGTVEEDYWGKSPLPVANSPELQNVVSLHSPYLGVSWWYRNFTPPALKPGEKLIFSFPGARLRAEVYANGKLVGYNLITEIPCTADATAALKPGQPNQLAVRITNPGGTGNLDILQEILPKTRKRGMKVFCGAIDNGWHLSTPGVSQCAEVDLYGRKAGSLCLLNPNVQQFWVSLASDYCKSYDVDGFILFNERNGPLLNALGASHLSGIASDYVTCFCDFHQNAARQLGISFDRAREGYRRSDQYVKASLAGHRPTDGYFVEFWRLLTEYPEIILWNKLFDTSKYEILKSVREAVKNIRPDLQVGFHIEHVNSFNPIFRAARGYAELADMADFFKPVVYNNCGGERYATFIKNIHKTVFHDVPNEEMLRFNNHLLNYEHEAALDQLPAAGLSPDYVKRETRRAVDGVSGKPKAYPGIDIGIPAGRKASPEDTYAAVTAALAGGADGLILSRKYSEMELANLSAAGRAAREFKA